MAVSIAKPAEASIAPAHAMYEPARSDLGGRRDWQCRKEQYQIHEKGRRCFFGKHPKLCDSLLKDSCVSRKITPIQGRMPELGERAAEVAESADAVFFKVLLVIFLGSIEWPCRLYLGDYGS